MASCIAVDAAAHEQITVQLVPTQHVWHTQSLPSGPITVVVTHAAWAASGIKAAMMIRDRRASLVMSGFRPSLKRFE
jgi:hypothetical protein